MKLTRGRSKAARLIYATVFVAALTVPALTSPALARCAEEQYIYKFTKVSKSRRLSNLRSDYLEGPGTISYSRTKTAVAKAAMTATVAAEAGVVFAKASTSLGVTVGKEWSKSGTWTYSKPVPAGKTARLVMWHQSRKFLVTKKRLDGNECRYIRVYRSWVNAPVAANINVWGLQNQP